MSASLDDFTRAYIAALFFTSHDDTDQGNPLQGDEDDLADEAREKIVADCERFQRENAEALDAIPNRIGNDVPDIAGFLFALNRNGHGSGFWDEDQIPDPERTQLSDASHAFGEQDLYVGDDGKLYV